MLFASWPVAMINPQWLELPISRTNIYGPKDVRVSEVRLYFPNAQSNMLYILTPSPIQGHDPAATLAQYWRCRSW